MKFRDAYIWTALGIVVVNFIVRNFLLVVYHLDILERFGYQKIIF